MRNRIVFWAGLLIIVLLPCVAHAGELQRVFLISGLADEGTELEMGHKSADNVFSYTFHTPKDNVGNSWLKFKIVRTADSDKTFNIGPEENDVNLTNNTTVNAGVNDNSFTFNPKSDKTYTVRIELGNYYEGKYDNYLVTLYEANDAPAGVIPDSRIPLLVMKNGESKVFTQGAYRYYYCDLDLSETNSDIDFKFFDTEDNEYVGCEYMGFRVVDKYGFQNFYWGSNELGPERDSSQDDLAVNWRNEYFTLRHSVSGIKKYRVNIWKDARNSIGGAQTWKFYVQDMDNFDPDAAQYYFVSRELTGAARVSAFAMSPSKERNGGEDIKTLWSFNIQDFMLKNILGEDRYNNLEKVKMKVKNIDGTEIEKDVRVIHYHIEDKNGNTYTSHTVGDNQIYDLGFRFENAYNPEEEHNVNDIGRLLRYERYDNLQNGTKDLNGYLQNTFVLPVIEDRELAKEAVSYTWLYDSNLNKLSIHINAPHLGKKNDKGDGYYEDPKGYSLVGNLSEAKDGEDYDNDGNIEVQKAAYSRHMRKFWYKGGKVFTYQQADADSVVYSVTIARPKKGWKTGGYRFVVFPYSAIEESQTNGWNDWDATWKHAIRPQEQWAYDDKYEGVDATALHGGLYMRSDTQTDNVQQSISVYPQTTTEAFTFSMNLTTSTYRFVRHSDLFIMGPAVGCDDETRDNGWNTDNPDMQTAHAYKLTFDDTRQCYMYKGADGTGDEQPIPMSAGKEFAFAYNKSFAKLFFEENYQKPVSLIDSKGNSIETTAYNYDRTVNTDDYAQQYDTQYVNFLRRGFTGRVAYNEDISPCVFGLPSKTDEGDGYYIRLYMLPTYNDPDAQQYFYTIRRDNSFSIPVDPKNPIAGYNTFKTYSDYHAVVIPKGMDAFYIKDTDKQNLIATLTEYPLGIGLNGERVLPAFSAVILATNSSVDVDGTESMKKRNIQLDYYYKPNFTEDNYEEDYSHDFSDNKLKGQIERATPSEFDGEYINFLFSYQKRLVSDDKYTIGFYKAGKVATPVNSAYLQLDKDFLDSGAAQSKGWRIVLGDAEVTGIDDVSEKADNVNGTYYTLQGIKVCGPQTKGVYIYNGKKVVVE